MSLSNGEQKIFVWIDFTSASEISVLHGIQVAMILDKELCLMCQIDNESIMEEATTKLNGLATPIHPILGMDRVHHYISRQPLYSDYLLYLPINSCKTVFQNQRPVPDRSCRVAFGDVYQFTT